MSSNEARELVTLESLEWRIAANAGRCSKCGRLREPPHFSWTGQ